MIKAFIFDIDGTLVDTNKLHINAWLAAFEAFGVRVTPAEIQAQLGRRAIDIAKTILPDDKKDDFRQVVEEKWRVYQQYFSLVKPIPMAKELFLLLHSRGIKLALATSTIRRDAEFYVDVLAVKDLIGALVTAEDIQHSKPDPEIFQKAADQLHVETRDAVAVGDSPHDMRAATRAGMTAIGVLTGGYAKAELESAGAQRVYSDIKDIYAHIDQIL